MISKLKGKNRFETIENYIIVLIFLGSLMLVSGIGLSVLSSRGFPIILAMIGAFISFISTVALIFTWLVKEFKE